MYYGANQINEYKYRTFFEKLEHSISNELRADAEMNHKTTNNYKLKKVPTLTIESGVKLRDRELHLKTDLDVNFPRKANPKVLCMDSVRSPIVNSETGEIDYSSFYTWDGNTSKISALLRSIQNYFISNPPQQSKELEYIKKVISTTREVLNQRIANFNVEKFQATLSPEEVEILFDADKNYHILMNSDDLKEVKKYVARILHKILQYVGWLIRRNQSKGSYHKLYYQQKPGRYRTISKEQTNPRGFAGRLQSS